MSFSPVFIIDLALPYSFLQIIMAQEEILIKERELEMARRKLETIRKAKYKDHPMDDDSSGSAF